jgi:hypothetical protein
MRQKSYTFAVWNGGYGALALRRGNDPRQRHRPRPPPEPLASSS